AGRAMAEKCRAEAVHVEGQRLGPRVDPAAVVRRQVRLNPVIPREPGLLGRRLLSIGVANEEVGTGAELACAGERLGRHRPGEHVPAEDDLSVSGHFSQHGVQRRQISVDVVEGRDLQIAASASTKPKKTTLMTPFMVKKAAFSRRRSPGRTSECSYASSTATATTPSQ